MKFIDHLSLLGPEECGLPSDDRAMALAMTMGLIHDLMEDNHMKVFANGMEFINDKEREKTLLRTGLQKRPIVGKK